MSDRSFPQSWSYFPERATPDPKVRSSVPALTILTKRLKPFWDAGFAAGDTTTDLLLTLDPDSVQAAAYRFGVNRLALNFDDLRGPSYEGRHHRTETTPVDLCAPVLLEIGGHGESHEDNHDVLDGNRDMVGVA